MPAQGTCVPSVRSVKRITILSKLAPHCQVWANGRDRATGGAPIFRRHPACFVWTGGYGPTHVRCRDRMYLFCLLPAQLARASRAAHPVQDHSHETLAPCRRVALADVSVLHGGSPEVGPCGPSFGSRKSKSRAHWLGPAPRMTRRSACSNQIPAIAASLRRRSACFRPKTGFRMFRWNGGIAAISGQESHARHLGAYQA
ncbi:hypothetical protein ACVWXM_002409 [Bradyrhizobium sp. GM7.3]